MVGIQIHPVDLRKFLDDFVLVVGIFDSEC